MIIAKGNGDDGYVIVARSIALSRSTDSIRLSANIIAGASFEERIDATDFNRSSLLEKQIFAPPRPNIVAAKIAYRQQQHQQPFQSHSIIVKQRRRRQQ